MEKLLNDQMLIVDVLDQPVRQNDLLVSTKENNRDIEGEIEFGNLQDYLEIYGDLEDN